MYAIYAFGAIESSTVEDVTGSGIDVLRDRIFSLERYSDALDRAALRGRHRTARKSPLLC